ncbi:MAG TPA: ABC transporter permease [Candidatus Polarisedimenticolia bacterium]|nr:ABC transporter permease [Candidatus Polarisedimenticolia bacterium]
MSLALASYSLWRREQVRFFRQGSRVFGAFVQPLMFWALFGAGLGASFRPAGAGSASFKEYFFPGTIILVLLFTAIFSTISVIEDRREGFLQGVLVAPIPRSALVLGKVLGGTTLAVLQGAALMVLAPLAGLRVTVVGILESLVIQVVVAFALTALSFCIAWRMESTQGFHAIMTVFLMPLWLLSGAFFPAEGAPGWLAILMRINPLTYGVAALRRVLERGAPAEAMAGLPSWPTCIAVTLLFAAVTFTAASYLTLRRGKDGR